MLCEPGPAQEDQALLLFLAVALLRRGNQAGIDDLARHRDVAGSANRPVEAGKQSLDGIGSHQPQKPRPGLAPRLSLARTSRESEILRTGEVIRSAQLAELSLAPASGCPFGSAKNRRSVKSELFTDDY